MQERTPYTAIDSDQALMLMEWDGLTIVQASRRLKTTLGYTDTELESMSFSDVFAQPSRAELETLLRPIVRDEAREIACQAIMRDQNGRNVAADLLIVRIDTQAGPLLATLLRFIAPHARPGGTPRLGPGNAPFVDFASRLGHDMNNLLGTVIGSLGLIREEGLGGPGDETHQLVDDALSAGRECADILDRLMAAAGKQLLRPQRLSVNTVIERLAPLLAQTLPDNIELRISLDPALPELDLDPDRLEAAIIGLVVNAREAMPSGGELVISSSVGEASSVRPPLEPGRNYVQITVSDAGTGIPEDLLARVLDPLFTTKSSGTGRGLGLSIVNGFVQQSGGALSLDSSTDMGTRVTLNFPPAD